ncbi:unnamed protein product [Hanseniaspora opuntiae]
MTDLNQLDNLFDELDTINTSLKKEDTKSLEDNENILQLDNNITKHDRFKEIEENLKKLPKLKNTFDKLCYTEKDAKDNTMSITLNDDVHKSTKISKKSEYEVFYDKELKRNLLILKNRHALDPKRHYRKLNINMDKVNDYKVGTIIGDMFDNGKNHGGVMNKTYINGSMTNSMVNKLDKNKSILGNYLDDKDTDKYFKRKYFEIQESKTRYGKSKYRFKNKK